MNRAIAPVLATVCGVATAFAAFQPEFQKQAAERKGQNVHEFQNQHGGGAIPPTSRDPSIPSIDTTRSIGAETRNTLTKAKDEAMTKINHIKNEAKTDVAPKKAWWGLAMFGASQGGSESPRENESENENENENDKKM